MKYELDLEAFTLNGQAIQTEDIIILLSRYHHLHPEDKHIEKVLALWAYGRE